MAASTSQVKVRANMTAKNKIFYFWGVMDVIGIVFYSIGPYHLLESWWVSTGGNPGVIIFMLIAGGVIGIVTGAFYLVYLLMPVSLLFSAWFFSQNIDMRSVLLLYKKCCALSSSVAQ
ncbi:hypothetical protein NHG68_07010 [Enterobacter sp. Z1]|nr:hypothetical protein NHG68_07010 [Enterobacter sp. Z1]